MGTIYMKYVGKSSLTVKKDDICELVAIKRVPLNSDIRLTQHFPSGLMLAFKNKEGHTLLWCDRNEWIKYNK